MAALIYNSPIGELLITAYEGHIRGVNFTFEGAPGFVPSADVLLMRTSNASKEDAAVLQQCADELKSYFDGRLKKFTVPLKTEGTAFRQRVWEALLTIPYGETISYKELAIKIGNPAAIRAVGGANHHNPVNIIIPCHRVIGTGGTLVGYGGGLGNKETLLELEKQNM